MEMCDQADLAMERPAGLWSVATPKEGGGCGRETALSLASARAPQPRSAWLTIRLALMGALLLTPTIAACASGGGVAAGPAQEPEDAVYADDLEVDFAKMERTSGGLWIEVVMQGVGRQAVRGREAVIHFVGFLPDGTIIDSSLSGDPYAFELGSGDVIRGWNEGIVGMKVGERRRLVVRPSLGYGGRGKPPAVPPNSILVFDIQLMDVR